MARRYYQRRSFNYRGYNESQRAAAKAGLAGIDDDVLQIFSKLNGLKRNILFAEYERAYGKSAGDYARDKMAAWASGTVKASGQTLIRLLNLVPKTLDQTQRYDLLKKLYDSHRRSHVESHSLTVVIGHSLNLREEVTNLALRLCQKPDSLKLPAHVESKIQWVCDNDSSVARALMAAIEKEESYAIASTGRAEVDRLVEKIQRADVSLQGLHVIKFPYGEISVHVRPPTFMEKLGKFFSS